MRTFGDWEKSVGASLYLYNYDGTLYFDAAHTKKADRATVEGYLPNIVVVDNEYKIPVSYVKHVTANGDDEVYALVKETGSDFYEWTTGNSYYVGAKVKISNASTGNATLYICQTSHTAGEEFDETKFTIVGLSSELITYTTKKYIINEN